MTTLTKPRRESPAPKAFVGRAAAKAVSGEPVESVERKVWILLELLRHKEVSFPTYARLYERSDRSFKRDLQHLRKIGERTGFSISYTAGGAARLETFDARLRSMDKSSKALAALLRDAAHALGAPVEREIGALIGDPSDSEDRFLYFALPQLLTGSHVASVFEALKKAWSASARVRFRYADGEERTVEPYIVINRSGRYYLVAYDPAKGKGWRYFALDRIADIPQTAGTFHRRTLDKHYVSGDTIGMLHKDDSSVAVTVALSASIAASATSRLWQRDQVIRRHPDGTATIIFRVADPDEVIRWAFGFGTEARVIAPPEAVASAKAMLREMSGKFR